MPNEDYLRSIIYNLLTNYRSDLNYYVCGYPKTFYYQYGSSDTWKQDDTLICILTNAQSIPINSDGSMSSKNTVLLFRNNQSALYQSNSSSYSLDITKPLYGNMYIDNSGFANEVFQNDLLVDTAFYQNKKINELKEVIVSNSGGSSNVSVNMDNTNNILMSILLAICVLIIFLVFRKLFFRGV